MIIERILTCNAKDLTAFLVASFSEGYRFMERFVEEFDSEENMFDKEGEGLFAAKIDNQIVGIISINVDPFLNKETIGRVRHLYVLPQFRNRGIASALLRTVVELGSKYFQMLTLYSDNFIPEKLYTQYGFIRSNEYDRTSHILEY